MKRVGDNFEVALEAGETIEATLPKPAAVLPAPANAAEPVVLKEVTGLPRTSSHCASAPTIKVRTSSREISPVS